jgi:hypothetical protein
MLAKSLTSTSRRKYLKPNKRRKERLMGERERERMLGFGVSAAARNKEICVLILRGTYESRIHSN